MMLSDYGKLIILSIGLIGAIVLLATHTIDDAAGVGLITGIIGYVTGNGVLATTNKPPSVVLAPKYEPPAE